jgi:hypothetical protein
MFIVLMIRSERVKNTTWQRIALMLFADACFNNHPQIAYLFFIKEQ